MIGTFEAALARISAVAEDALREPGTPQAVIDKLRTILSLTRPQSGDTPEASDPPQTENQTL